MRNANIQSPTLDSLIRDLDADRFHIPYFQRGFDWDGEDIRQLMFSVFNDYYIGSLLVWQADETLQEVIECESIYGYDESKHVHGVSSSDASRDRGVNVTQHDVVLDGQQRLSAMYYAFFGPDKPLRHRPRPDRYFIDIEKFVASSAEEACEDGSIVRRLESDEDRELDARRFRNRAIFSAEEEHLPFGYDEKQQHLFPIRLLGTGDESEWLLRYIDFWNDRARRFQSLATTSGNRADRYEAEADEHQQRAVQLEAKISVASAQSPMAHPEVLEAQRLADEAARKVTQQAGRVTSLERELEALSQDENSALQEVQNAKGKSRQKGSQRTAELRRVQNRKTETAQNLANAKRVLEGDERLQDQREQERQEAEQRVEQRYRSDNAESSTMIGDCRKQAEKSRALASKERERVVHEERLATEARQHATDGQKLRRAIEGLRGSFTVPVLEIDASASGESVGAIFQQLNTRGKQVKRFDLLNAVLALREVPLRKDRDEFRARLASQGLWASRAEDDIVRMLLMRVHPESKFQLEERTYRSLIPRKSASRAADDVSSALFANTEEFRTHWSAALEAYESALQALRDEGHYGKAKPNSPRDFVPFEGMLPVYANLRAAAREVVGKAGEDRVRQWYWASVLTERYSSSSGEASATIGSRDYQEVRAWLADGNDMPKFMRDFAERTGHHELPARRLYSNPELPVPGLMRGIQILMLVLAPRDLATGEVYSPAAVVESEVIPLSWCQSRGVSDVVSRSVFNQMLIGDAADEAMHGSMPCDYLEEIFEGRDADEMRAILDSHCISIEAQEILERRAFDERDLVEFLAARQAEFVRRVDREIFGGDGTLPIVPTYR